MRGRVEAAGVTEWQVAVTVPLTEALTQFLEDVNARGRAVRTLEYYRWQLTKFIEWLADRGVTDLAGLEAREIRAYIVSLRERGLADTSQHAAARAIRAWCLFLVREELLTSSPMRKVGMPKKGKRILPALSVEDVRRLLQAAHQTRDGALILFLLDTGVRAAECLALNIGDVNLQTGDVFVLRGKGAKSRRTYIGERTKRALAGYLAERGVTDPGAPLWVSLTTGGRLSMPGLSLLLQRVADRAGLPHAGPHVFRRTCAITMHRSGARLTEIAGLLGHSDLPTLQKYLDLQAADFAAAHRAHGPADHLAL